MKVFLIILSLLALIGGGIAVWFFYDSSRATSDPATSSESTKVETDFPTEPTDESSGDSSLFSGTFGEALTRGQALTCSWLASEETAGSIQEGRGTFYTDGVSRGRSEATFIIDGSPVPTEGLFIDNNVYYWQTVGGTTLGFKLPETTFDGTSSLTPEEQASAIDIRSRYDFDCSPWTVDNSMFELPDGVEFISL